MNCFVASKLILAWVLSVITFITESPDSGRLYHNDIVSASHINDERTAETGNGIQSRFDSIEDLHQRVTAMLDHSWSIRNSRPEVSLELGFAAMQLADSIGDHFNLVKGLSFTGVAYRLLGDYNKAIDLFFRGLELSKEYNIPEQEGYAYINIANLYIYLEFYSQALENLVPALEIAKEISDKSMLSYVFLNKGRVLMHLNRTEEALADINRALEIRQEVGNIPGQAVCYKYIGDIHFSRKDFDQAIISYNNALQVVNQQQDRHLVGNLYLQQASIYLMTGQTARADNAANRALNIGREVHSRLLIHDALKIRSQVSLLNNDYRAASNYLTLINLYADTLFNQQLAEKVLSVEFQHERQRQQAEVDMIMKDKEIQSLTLSRQRVINFTLVIFIVFLVAAGGIMVFLIGKLKNKNRLLIEKQDELTAINKSKDRMFMVIGHDLRGPVWNLRALIELIREDQNENTPEDEKRTIKALSRAAQSVGDLLENLLFWAKSQDGKVNYKPGLTDLKYLVVKSIKPYKPWAESKDVKINFVADENARFVNADKNMIQAVVRNLISNAIKYSYRNSNIEIQLREQDGKSRFMIRDFGPGIEKSQINDIISNTLHTHKSGTENEGGSGIGLSICHEFLKKHNAELLIESIPGEETTFYFDIELMPQTVAVKEQEVENS